MAELVSSPERLVVGLVIGLICLLYMVLKTKIQTFIIV